MKTTNKYNGALLFIVVTILFVDFFKTLYNQYIVVKILNNARKSLVADLIFIGLILYLIYLTFVKLKINFYIKSYHIIYSTILIIGYLVIRHFHNDLLLESYTFADIKYFDMLIVLGVIPIILTVKYWATKTKHNNTSWDIINDLSKHNINDDILERKQSVIKISKFIKNQKSSSSLAIGIVGAWGDGKTTLMKFLESQFDNDDKYIVVHFNSWMNISVNSIISDFFNTVEEKIKVHSVDVSKEIKKYGKNVLSVSESSTAKTVLSTLQLIPENSLSEKFENLNYLLNKLDKRVIVFFDDLDRLQPNEVFEVLKLIRNTASFDVFNYIVGYDKDYIIEALKKNNIPFPEKYCEKIFLKEFPLKPITAKQINIYIKENIIKMIPEKESKLIEIFEKLETYIFYNNVNIFSSVRNIRNAKGFLMEFVNIKDVIDEVDVEDYILIKILKFSYYETYRLLFVKDSYLEHKEEGYSGAKKHTHYKLKGVDKNHTNLPGSGKSFENSLLKKDIIKLTNYDDLSINIVGSICDHLFSKTNFSDRNSALSISYGNNFYTYFHDEISDSNFTNSNFKLFLEGNYLKKREIIDLAYQQDTLNGLILFIYKVQIYADNKTKSNYQDFLKSIFYIANLKSLNKNTTYYGFDFDALDEFITNYKNQTVERFKYKNVDDLKTFYRSLFYDPREYYDFESDYIKHLFNRSGTSTHTEIPFTRDEMEEYLSHCFNNDSKLIQGVDDKFWHCYRLCRVKDWIKSSSNSWSGTEKIINKNKEKFLYEIVPLYLDELLVAIVNPESFYGRDKNSNKVGIDKDSPINLVGSIQDFIGYLESKKLNDKLAKPSIFKDEFIRFAIEFYAHKNYIDFKFSFSPILKKLKNSIINDSYVGEN